MGIGIETARSIGGGSVWWAAVLCGTTARPDPCLESEAVDVFGHTNLRDMAFSGSCPIMRRTTERGGYVRGDVILVGEEHRGAARIIIDHLIDEIRAAPRRFTITVAGESGSGKSEMGQALAEEVEERGVHAVVLQQDDYYVLPPKFNDAARRANFAWVGPTEVRIDLLDAHLQAAQEGASEITKPLVVYDDNTIVEETLSYEGAGVVIAEGVYTSLCDHVDRRVFIARNRLETMDHRMKRGREQFDPFIEKVLVEEHEIISQHRPKADVIITRDYDVELVTR